MRKKLLIAFILILITLLTFNLVACSGDENIVGEVNITINLDKEYADLSVNCPEGTIKKNSETQYSVNLKSLLPVEVVIYSPGYEVVTLSYTTKQLNENSNITENLKLKQELYRFSFISENKELELAKDYNNIKLTVSAGKYVLESERPINQNIILTAGNDYKDVVLFKEMFIYAGSNGNYSQQIPLIGKNDQQVAMFIPSIYKTEYSFVIDKLDDLNNPIILNCGEYTMLENLDYSVRDMYTGNLSLLSLKDIDDGYYCYQSEVPAKTFKYTIPTEEIDLDYLYADYLVDYRRYNSETVLYSNRELVPGDKFAYEYRKDVNEYVNYHIITAEELESGLIHITDDNSISDFYGKKFTLTVKDKDGNVVEGQISIDNNIYNDGDEVVFDSIDKHDYYLRVSHPTINYDDEYFYDAVYSAIVSSDDSVVNIEVVVKQLNKINIIYRDISSNQIVEDFNRTLNVYDGYVIRDLSPYDSNYSVIGAQGIIYFNEVFGDTIEVKIAKNYKVNIHITNLDSIEFVDNSSFVSADKKFIITRLDIDYNGNVKLVIPGNLAGKSLQFTLSSYTGELKYFFTLDLPNDLENIDTINVTVLGVDDEW